MRKRLCRYFLGAGLLLIFFTGCSSTGVQQPQNDSSPQISVQQTQQSIQQAEEYFQIVNSLSMQRTYPIEYQEARNALRLAEELLQENQQQEAFLAAQKSAGISRHLLNQFYQHTIAQLADDTREDIEGITQADPDNPLQDFLPRLNMMLDYSEQIRTGQTVLDPQKLLDDYTQLKHIEYNTQTNMHKILEADAYFAPGQYELSEKGKERLEEWSENILINVETFAALAPVDRILLKFKVVGYTDELDFREGTTLLQELQTGVEDAVPQQQPERRKFFNQRLSEFRAKTISAYLVETLTEMAQLPENMEIFTKSQGLGETRPPRLAPPYPEEDPRRRICKIYTSMTAGMLESARYDSE